MKAAGVPNADATAAGVDNSRAHSAIEGWAGNWKNGIDEGLAYTAQWPGIVDVVTANVSTDFAALTGSTDLAKIIGDAQKPRHSWSRFQRRGRRTAPR